MQTTQDTARTVIFLEPGAGEPVWFLDNFVTVKVRSTDGAPFGLIESMLPPGSCTPFHRHRDEDEAFYVLEGRLTIYLEGGRVLDARAGTYVHIPRGVAHGFRVDETIRMLVLSDPAGFVEFVREMGVPASRRALPPAAPPDMARLGALAEKYHIDILGHLPD